MKKMWNKILRIFASISLVLFIIEKNAFAAFKADFFQCDYGVVMPEKESENLFLEKALPIIKWLLIPLILIIGLIIYWKKGKAERKIKKYVIITIIVLVALTYGILLFSN